MELSSQVEKPRAAAAGFRAIGRGIALSLFSAALATLSLPPYPTWPLIFVAFVPMLLAWHRVLPLRWSALAPAVTIGLFFASQLLPGMHQAGVPVVFQLLPLYAGVIVAALAWRTRRFHQRTAYRWFFLATPAAWVAIDFLRGSGIEALAGTWANPAYALWSQPWLIQPVSIFGIYGLELLLLVVNWSIAGAAISALDRSGPPHARAIRPLLGCGAATVGRGSAFRSF